MSVTPKLLVLVLVHACIILTIPGLFASQVTSPRVPVDNRYLQLCANCHGAELRGASATSLVDGETHVADEDSLARYIREGHQLKGMQRFDDILSASEIRALVVYIKEQRAKRNGPYISAEDPPSELRVKSQLHSFVVETVTEGVIYPWAVAFLPDGRMLITEKTGRLRVMERGRLLPQPVAGTPSVLAKGQGGLLDVAVHPQYTKNGWIYLSYTDGGPQNVAMTTLVRGRLTEGVWVQDRMLFKLPLESYRHASVHFGSRIVFDDQHRLYFSIGELGHPADAQDLARPNGKVHRLFDDGRVPSDNPFRSMSMAMPSIWSYGHRNPQGLAMHPVTGELWEVEHGPRGGDELNRLEPGRNYGWPVITHGINYGGTPIAETTAQKDMEQAVHQWTPSITVSSMDFYSGDKFQRWKNNLFVTTLTYQDVRRLVIENAKVVHEEILFKGLGRVRDIVSGPDGFLYIVFNEPDRIARIMPL